MEKINLCKCNNCGNILHDTNPKDKNAVLHEVDSFMYPSLEGFNVTDNEGETEYFGHCCPFCETDEYLTDQL